MPHFTPHERDMLITASRCLPTDVSPALVPFVNRLRQACEHGSNADIAEAIRAFPEDRQSQLIGRVIMLGGPIGPRADLAEKIVSVL
jgi:hypothetical protein